MSALAPLVHALAPLVHALGWALVHALWQAAVVAGLVRLALVVARDPKWRFVWASAGSLAVALAVLATGWLSFTHAGVPPSSPSSVAVAAVSAGLGGQVVAKISTVLPILVLLWACGATGFGLRLGAGWLGVRRLRAEALPLSAELSARASQLAARFGLHREVRFVESAAAVTPMTVGWLRPMVLIPLGLALRLSPAQLDAALAHELAHVRRCDYLLNLVQATIETALFYHPCVWWLGRVARRERELACDDLAVARSESPLTYARTLLVLESLAGARDGEVGLAMAARGASGHPALRERVQRLLKETRPMHTTRTRTRTRTRTHTSASRRHWAPLLLITGTLVALTLSPACSVGEQDRADLLEELEASPEGTVAAGVSSPDLDIAWMPDPVLALTPQIEAAAQRHGLDPALVAIVTLLESGGDPGALSSTGAVGLMQLMPATADKIAAERALGSLDHARLYEPEFNLDMGSWYLARQLERWGDIELAAAAYNGGPTAVERWLAGEGELSEETTRYKDRVSALWRARAEAELRDAD